MTSLDGDRSQAVPSWDGNPRTWRRYTKEVGWFLSGTKSNQRRYAAAKLISKLTGPARLLSMSWHRSDFDGEEGVTVMLQRLAASPLVRRSLPNAAAIMNEYFNFRRKPGESISQFLVRETLGFEEFQEALLELKDDRDGISPAQRAFDLPEIVFSAASDRATFHHDWARWRPWQPQEQDDPDVDGETRPPQGDNGYSQVPQSSEKGISPDGSPQRGRGPDGDPVSPSRGAHLGPVSRSLGPMDTFILDVLRGWRLLVAASLSADEWRDILASTGNKLDYHAIAEALQTLWDEQVGGSQMRMSHPHFTQHWTELDNWYDGMAAWREPDWSHEDWHPDPWFDNFASSSWDVHGSPSEVPVESSAPTEDDPAVVEALEAERAAEALALEAKRTWSQAQQATAALRRDRGFGQHAGSSGKGSGTRCFICNGNHLARDCPDRQHTSFRKGFGKQLSQAELDAYLFSKGKGKGFKGKSKDQFSTYWDEPGMYSSDLMAFHKGKKGSFKGKNKTSANVYGLDFNFLEPYSSTLYPLELYTSADLHPPAHVMPEGCGMLDCGATASAGPEASVKKLISSLCKVDEHLGVSLDTSRRPFFRYGSGRWGQALYQVEITSSQQPHKSFRVFALPNPDEYYQKTFEDYMLVPILVGMDYLAKVGLILDFSDGHALHGADPLSEPFVMNKNAKGHYMVDIAQYLCGKSVPPSQVTSSPAAGSAFHLQADVGWGEWYELSMTVMTSTTNSMTHTSSHNLSTLSDGFQRLVQRRRSLCHDSTASATLAENASCPSHTCPDVPSDPYVHDSAYQGQRVPEGQPCGSRSHDLAGSSGSQVGSIMLAVQRQAHALHQWRQRFGNLGEVLGVCTQSAVHPTGRQSRVIDHESRPDLCQRSPGVSAVQDASRPAAQPQSCGESVCLDGMPRSFDGRQKPCEELGKRAPEHPTDSPRLGEDGSLHAKDLSESPSGEPTVSSGRDLSASHSRRSATTDSPGQGPNGIGDTHSRGGGRGCGSCGESTRQIETPDSLGTSMPEAQIEQFTKTVRFSETTSDVEAEGNSMQPIEKSLSLLTGDDLPHQDNDDVPEEAMFSAEFELLKYTETKMCKQRSGGRSRKTKHPKGSISASAGLQPTSEREGLASASASWDCTVPWKICQALVAMMSMLLLTAQGDLRAVLRADVHVDVWEVFCAPESWLSQAVQSEGMVASRINLHQGYDLYKHDTYVRLWDKFLQERPRRIWVASRYTYWCPFTSLHYQTVEDRALLEKYRRRERAMFRDLVAFVSRVVSYDPSVEFFWEWPTRCYGWNEPLIQNLSKIMLDADKEWLFSRIDGCRYGLLSEHGKPLRKQWTIATSSRHFFDVYRNRTCTGSHEHDVVQGVDTSRSASYPWRMVKSISQFWRRELYPDRWLDRLHAPIVHHLSVQDQYNMLQLDAMPHVQEYEPNAEEKRLWDIQLLKYHKAAGHPNNYNLARIIREAGKERWRVQAAFNLKCDDCAALKLGGDSSGRIPPASLRPLPVAWNTVGMDVTDWIPPNHTKKYKLLLLMDYATHFKSGTIVRETDMYKQEMENSQEVLDALFRCWLADKPKMTVLVPDNAKTLTSDMIRTVLSDLNIRIDPPPVKESWSHGLMERCCQEVKVVASKLFLSFPSCSPSSILSLALHSLNATELVQGYTPHQWVYGKQFSFSEEDERSMSQVLSDVRGPDFVQLLVNRSHAEEVARKSRAMVVLNKLKNSKVRQPLQVFAPTDLVKIWRKYSTDGGARGGLRKTGKAQWLGPGRVVFHEVINGQRPGDPRRHVVWIIIAGHLHRCSVHSVRKVTERERLDYELHHPENPADWRTLADMLPNRSYIDLTHEEPDEDEEEFPHLPRQPDESTIQPNLPAPFRRHRFKSPGPPALPAAAANVPIDVPDISKKATDEGVGNPEMPVNDYSPSLTAPGDIAEETGNDGLGSGVPTLEERQGVTSTVASSRPSKAPLIPAEEPDSKRVKLEGEDLLFATLETVEEAIVFHIDLEVNSQRERNKLEKCPSLFLAQKLRDCEVRLEKLTPAHRELFQRAKSKEVNSFISNAAVRRCKDATELQEAFDSNRIMRCRWVLTWKPTPVESVQEALEEVASKPDTTTFTADGFRKAKARIVLLGFEHPDLLQEGHKTAAPVQALLTRHLSYQLVMQMDWDIEGIDMSTAFLQTLPTEEEKRLWTTGVDELKDALQVPRNSVLRILKNFYGSTTAPRNLWQNVDTSMKSLGAINIKGDSCFWLWLVKDEHSPKIDCPYKPLGFVAGHVDDFHRAGDRSDDRWIQICKAIDQMYKWGSVKCNAYRHAGTDLEILQDPKLGRCLVIDQKYYIETLQDVDVTPSRFSDSDSQLTTQEISACRASLGALQWLAIQTQPLICARCNILLTELSTNPKMTIAQEIQEMIKELRKTSSVLKFFKIPDVKHWTDLCVIGLGDQAHNNRPRGGSTGGMLIFLGGPSALKGEPCNLVLVAWKSWKLKRVSISTNDAEVQALVETEDSVYRTRLLWAEIHGAGQLYSGRNLLEIADAEVRMVPGILGTDSKGGWDSIMVNESPLLGLSNMRAAIQAYQLKEVIKICLSRLIWLAGDWNLSDSLTKKKPESRESMLFFLQHRSWMLKFDPEFIKSARKIKASSGSPAQQMQETFLNSSNFWVGAIDHFHPSSLSF